MRRAAGFMPAVMRTAMFHVKHLRHTAKVRATEKSGLRKLSLANRCGGRWKTPCFSASI